MRRSSSPAARIGRAFYVFWLMFVLTQPVAIHACPLRSESVRPLTAQQVLAQGVALCELDGMQGVHAPSSEQSTGHHTDGQCHCIGACCASMNAIPPRSGPVVPIPAELAAADEQFPSVERSFHEPDYRLPPSTAPPTFA